MTDISKTTANEQARGWGRFTARLQTFRAAQAALAECSNSSLDDDAHNSPETLRHEGAVEAFACAEDTAAAALLTTPAMDVEQLAEKLAIFALYTDPSHGLSPYDSEARQSVMDDVERLLRAHDHQQDLAA